MIDNNVWEQVTPLEFKSSFCHFWREDSWKVKFSDSEQIISLKAETLKQAFPEVTKAFLEKKYIKKAKVRKKRRSKKC